MEPSFLELRTIWRRVAASRPGRFTLEGRGPSTRRIGGWLGPRAGMDDVEK
jgi:hypothetical protein